MQIFSNFFRWLLRICQCQVRTHIYKLECNSLNEGGRIKQNICCCCSFCIVPPKVLALFTTEVEEDIEASTDESLKQNAMDSNKPKQEPSSEISSQRPPTKELPVTSPQNQNSQTQSEIQVQKSQEKKLATTQPILLDKRMQDLVSNYESTFKLCSYWSSLSNYQYLFGVVLY